MECRSAQLLSVVCFGGAALSAVRCKRMSLGALQVAALAKRAALFATCASNCVPAHDTQRTATTPESVAAFSLRCCSAGIVVHARACECVRTRPQLRMPWASASVTAAVRLPPCSQRAVLQPCCAALQHFRPACLLACLLGRPWHNGLALYTFAVNRQTSATATPSAHRCHICTGTGLAPATSAPGLGSSAPHLHSAPGTRPSPVTREPGALAAALHVALRVGALHLRTCCIPPHPAFWFVHCARVPHGGQFATCSLRRNDGRARRRARCSSDHAALHCLAAAVRRPQLPRLQRPRRSLVRCSKPPTQVRAVN
jgi:hypothetical protein